MQGLMDEDVPLLLQQYGRNTLPINETKRLIKILADIVREPMFLLLVAACILYFILGENTEGFMMIVALGFVAAISVFQEVKSSHALEALQQLTEPKVKVIRSGKEREIETEDLVPGDWMILEEGAKVPADARVVQENDLSVDESVITGESFPVEKDTLHGLNHIFQGTVINSGRCVAEVTATGRHTTLGKIGKSIMTYSESKTPLQQQIDVFVKRLALFGIVAFLVIFLVNYWHNGNVVVSLLLGLTLAMSAIPEEIPVAFSSFMALGAYHMARLGIITRQPQIIENLGAVNVICLDKTGTITENKMKVETVYDYRLDTFQETGSSLSSRPGVLYYGLLASEQRPFDAMEIAIQEAYKGQANELPDLKMVGEYALHGHPPMMTHVYAYNAAKLAAAKGGVERIIQVCRLQVKEKNKILELARSLATKGYRVLAVASAVYKEEKLPPQQEEFNWQFEGLLSFYDPPKPFVKEVLQRFYEAGITVKLLTGDFPETAMTIARETGLRLGKSYKTGEEVMAASEDELNRMTEEVGLFARMYPDAKLKVINAIRATGSIVAMTGDGVNDGPALKAANIGIAMGRKGTEVARLAADLIITNDDLQKLVEAIRQGRKIFSNLKKAVRYIVSIHIPIILTASLPLLMGWKYPTVFTPVHIIFLELIMGPTCSIFYEREPVEENVMKVAPRKREARLFETNELVMSVLQGLIITGGVLALYYAFMMQGASLSKVRSIVFTTLLLSNIFLTFANRSFTETFRTTIRYKNNLVLPVFILSVCFLLLIHVLPFVQTIFGMTVISFAELGVCLVVALLSVAWFELYKINLGRAGGPLPADYRQAFK